MLHSVTRCQELEVSSKYLSAGYSSIKIDNELLNWLNTDSICITNLDLKSRNKLGKAGWVEKNKADLNMTKFRN